MLVSCNFMNKQTDWGIIGGGVPFGNDGVG
jgi:hypothetical protein